MPITGGGKRHGKKNPKSRKSRRSTQKSKKSVGESHHPLIKERRRDKLEQFTFSDLRKIAKSKGIPFGGLKREELIHEIEKYY